MTKQMNHDEYQKALKKKSVAELMFIVRDASEAAACNGINSGYYADEVHYASAELRKRQQT